MYKIFTHNTAQQTPKRTLVVFGLLVTLLLFSSMAFAQRVTTIDAKGTRLTTGNLVNEGTTAPTNPTPIQGDVWFDTTNNLVKTYDGSTWKTVASFDPDDLEDDQNIENLAVDTATNELTVGIEDGNSQTVDLSGIVKEPWFGTDDDAAATTNTEDIYHMGRVGIGVDDPGTAKLNVQGGTTYWSASAANKNHTIEFSTPSGETGFVFNGSNAGNRSRFDIRNVDNGTVGNRYFGLAYNNETGLFIRKGGNVGIGTTAPTEKLDVNGQARIRTLNAGATADSLVVADTEGVLKKIPAPETHNYTMSAWTSATTDNGLYGVPDGVPIGFHFRTNSYGTRRTRATVIVFNGVFHILSQLNTDFSNNVVTTAVITGEGTGTLTIAHSAQTITLTREANATSGNNVRMTIATPGFNPGDNYLRAHYIKYD